MLIVAEATDQTEWDAFLLRSRFRPFLQSWNMGEVFRDIGQEPVRLVAWEGSEIVGICQAILVPARRGRHLMVQYGPVVDLGLGTWDLGLASLLQTLKDIAREHGCSFIRLSPFVPIEEEAAWRAAAGMRTVPSPLHLLGEHIWYLPLVKEDPWMPQPGTAASIKIVNQQHPSVGAASEETILMSMRKTTRNLIRRAEREGVTVRASNDPLRDLPLFLTLHNETKVRHGFTPYHDTFFRAQVAHFAPRHECTLYLAEYGGQVLASSIHMHVGGVTSYHHGASSHLHAKIPASYLLQWTAICDALRRGDHVYSFWGIAPGRLGVGSWKLEAPQHPFAGVTLFKTGFGGSLLNLMHCRDVPLSRSYHLTRAFELMRKWKRGF